MNSFHVQYAVENVFSNDEVEKILESMEGFKQTQFHSNACFFSKQENRQLFGLSFDENPKNILTDWFAFVTNFECLTHSLQLLFLTVIDTE